VSAVPGFCAAAANDQVALNMDKVLSTSATSYKEEVAAAPATTGTVSSTGTAASSGTGVAGQTAAVAAGVAVAGAIIAVSVQNSSSGSDHAH